MHALAIIVCSFLSWVWASHHPAAAAAAVIGVAAVTAAAVHLIRASASPPRVRRDPSRPCACCGLIPLPAGAPPELS